MKIHEIIERIFKPVKRRISLREKCIERYGEEFGALYDAVNVGKPIGNMEETTLFLRMVEAVRNEK